MSRAGFYDHLETTLDQIRDDGLWKPERLITSPQGGRVQVDGAGEVLNLCANNYLGLADHPDLAAAALAELGVEEWQWLRFKPSGRGADTYEQLALEAHQAQLLWPLAQRVIAQHGLRLRFDCALVPFLVAHEPPLEALEALAVQGCVGGHTLWARTTEGRFGPCSFSSAKAGVGDWQTDPQLQAWRQRAASPPEPCGSCTYRQICRGGCRVVAHHRGVGDGADPECPRVQDAARQDAVHG